MDGLQRSEISFRRQGSSGLVWDDKFLSGELNKTKEEEGLEFRELKKSRSVGSTPTVERSRSNGRTAYRAVKPVEPAIDPPSPKVSGCGFCSIFGKPLPAPKSGKRRK